MAELEIEPGVALGTDMVTLRSGTVARWHSLRFSSYGSPKCATSTLPANMHSEPATLDKYCASLSRPVKNPRLEAQKPAMPPLPSSTSSAR